MQWMHGHAHGAPHTSGGRAASWVNDAALAHLSGEHDLVVIRAGRFRDVPTLLRAWVTGCLRPGELAAGIVSPPSATPEADYWATVCGVFDGSAGSRAQDAASQFRVLLDTVFKQVAPVVLVLDDIHLVDDPLTRVQELLAHAGPGGLRVIVTDPSACVRRSPRTVQGRVVNPDSLAMDADAVADVFDDAGVGHHPRTPHLVARATGGLPLLVDAVRTAIPSERLRAPRGLEFALDDLVQRELEAAIRGDRTLAPLRRELLLVAAADVIDERAVELLPSTDIRADLFIETLASSGIAEALEVDESIEWRMPGVVRSALLRSAQTELPDVLHSYRSALILDRAGEGRIHAAAALAAESERWEFLSRLFRENIDIFYAGGLAATIVDPTLLSAPANDPELDPLVQRLIHLHDRLAGPRDRPVLPPVNDPGEVPGRGVGATDVDPDRLHTFLLALEQRAAGRFDDAAAECDLLVNQPAPDPSTLTPAGRDARAFSLLHCGMCYLLVGRFDDALAALRSCSLIAFDDFIRRDCAGKLALTYAVLGNVEDAASWSDEERSYPVLADDAETLVRPAGDVAAALINLDRMRVGRAVQTLRDLGKPEDSEELWGFVLYAWGRVGLITGSPDITLRSVNAELARFSTMRGHGSVVGPLLDAVRADLHLAAGRPHDAAELLSDSRHHATAPARSRLLLLTGEPRAALAAAERALADPLTTTIEGLELCLVAAASSLALGDAGAASEFVRTAANAHSTTSLRFALRCLPGQVTRRLISLSALLPGDPDILGPEFGTISFSLSPDESGRGSHTPGAAPEPRPETLTDREIVVLRSLPTGATVRQIAELHFVSTNTVKTQLRSVYKKLAVGSREDAVASAARLGLLSSPAEKPVM